MHWKLLSEKPLLVYELYDDEKPVLTLSINYKTSIFRAECKWGKRVFFINKEGIWKDKTVLKNEYGVVFGKASYEKWHSDKGAVEIDNKKFNYTFKNNPTAELVFYKNNPDKPVLTCKLKPEKGTVKIKSEKLDEGDNKYFLFALSWYLFLPIAMENTIAEKVAK